MLPSVSSGFARLGDTLAASKEPGRSAGIGAGCALQAIFFESVASGRFRGQGAARACRVAAFAFFLHNPPIAAFKMLPCHIGQAPPDGGNPRDRRSAVTNAPVHSKRFGGLGRNARYGRRSADRRFGRIE